MNLYYVEISDWCSEQYVEAIHMTYKGALKSLCRAVLGYLIDMEWDEEENMALQQAKAKDLEALSIEELEELQGFLQGLGELAEVYSYIHTATLQP